MLQLLIEKIDANPDPRVANRRPANIAIDFEKAAELAFRTKMPNATLHGCWFHCKQCHWRKIQALGLAVRYGQEPCYELALRKFSALAFCDVADVAQRFNTHAENFIEEFGDSQAHQDFIEYMENVWIGRARRTPQFPPAMWNARGVTLLDLPRTTNSVESWHSRLQQTFTSPHPNFSTFLEGLLVENVHANAICVKLEAGDVPPLYTRREYQQANNRLLELLNRYNDYPPDEYLSQCAHYV